LKTLAVAALAVAACAPVTQSESSPPPANACPANPCSAYGEGGAGASCVGGACVAGSPPGDLIVTVALPEDAFSGPGRTVVVRLADLLASPSSSTECTDGPSCVKLPPAVSFSDAYIVSPSLATNLQSQLLPGIMLNTSLPLYATYVPLWPANATSIASSAVAAGLPAFPVMADTSVVSTVAAVPPSGTGPALGIQTYLLSGGNYARVLAPAPPYDQEFPPDVQVVAPFSGDGVQVMLDHTAGALPTFSLSRSDGPMDGWGTYLRDAASKTTLSPIKTLSGYSTPDGGVVLPTAHTTQNVDALLNTELVIAPSSDAGLPSEVFSLPLPQESYAVLPHRIDLLTGLITWSDGVPLDADVIFEALAIYAAPAASGSPGDDAGTLDQTAIGFQPQPNFEYTVLAHAIPSALGSTYTITNLPRGIYRIIVHPDDGALAAASGLAPVHAATIYDCFDTTDGISQDGGATGDGGDGGIAGDAGTTPSAPMIDVSAADVVQGSATLTDGRALFGATVVATPVACPPPTNPTCPLPADSTNCMPRASQTGTAADGSFSLSLDPGSYAVHVEPASGTALPWMSQVIASPGSAPLTVNVGPPTLLHLQLADATDPLVGGAVVRVYALPLEGPAIEVGLAITDALGRFDMYLDPGLQ
jgi:hypothetical protein